MVTVEECDVGDCDDAIVFVGSAVGLEIMLARQSNAVAAIRSRCRDGCADRHRPTSTPNRRRRLLAQLHGDVHESAARCEHHDRSDANDVGQ